VSGHTEERIQRTAGTGQNAGVTLDKSGSLWRGDTFDDLAEYIRHFKAGGYPVAKVVESRCGECDGRT
jgi:hypothetical protein